MSTGTMLTADDIRLDQTCGARPEQYDAYDPDGSRVGYLRLRHGWFTVDMPDGTEVYSAQPLGDGIFEPDERDGYLRTAREKIAEHVNAVRVSGGGGIQVTVTIRELLGRHVWDQACDMLGLSPQVVNEGRMEPGERLTFTFGQAWDLGLLRGE